MRFMISLFMFMIADIVLCASMDEVNVGGIQTLSVAFSSDGMKGLVYLQESGFWKTEDAGQNWSCINSELSTAGALANGSIVSYDDELRRCVIRATPRFPYGEGAITWYTTNGGVSWNRNYQTLSGTEFAFDRFDSTIYYRNANGVLQKSVDEGGSWSSIEMTFTASSPYWFHQSYQDSNEIFILGRTDESPSGAIHKSVDRGDSWQLFQNGESLGLVGDHSIISFMAVNSDTLFIGYLNYQPQQECILRSCDGGLTWEDASEGLPYNSFPRPIVAFNGRLFTSTSASGLFSSDNLGDSWYQVYNGLPQASVFVSDININRTSQRVFISVLGRGIYVLHAEGNQWIPLLHPPVGGALSPNSTLSVNEGSISFLSQGSQNFYSVLGNGYFVELEQDFVPGYFQSSYPFIFDNDEFQLNYKTKVPYAIDSMDAQLLLYQNYELEDVRQLPFVSNEYEQLEPRARFNGDGIDLIGFSPMVVDASYWTSSDTGATWVEHAPDWQYGIAEYSVHDNNIAIISQSNELFVSMNFGDTWSSVQTDFNSFGFDRSNPLWVNDSLFVSVDATIKMFEPDGIWETRGDLSHLVFFDWTYIENEYYSAIVYVSDQNQLIAISEDGGVSWDSSRITLPGVEFGRWCYNLEYDPYRGRLWAATNTGLAYLDIEELHVAEEEVVFHSVDDGMLSLYPNPFNTSTTVTCLLPRAGKFQLSIFDILGRDILDIADGWREPGYHQFSIHGQALSSGTYFLKMETSERSFVKRMVVIK